MYGTVEQVLGIRAPAVGGPGPAAPTAHMGTDDLATGWRALVDPANPLLWLGIVLAVAVGAAGVAGSVRLGRARLAVDVGEG